MRYVLINGRSYRVETQGQQKKASAALSVAGINAARVFRDGTSTADFLLADSDVDSIENGTSGLGYMQGRKGF